MRQLLLPRGYRNSERLLRRLHAESEKAWVARSENRALSLFHSMALRVPAYKDFLKVHNFSPNKVKTIKDFHKIPPINKDNYLRVYPKEKLCWDGQFSHGQWVISTTSGSTGQPYYFPREQSQDWQYAITAENYLRNNFEIQNKSTLYIVAFPMGAWIGGLFTYQALKIIADNGDYDMSIITPGIHKQEVINAVKQLGGDFDQIIIGAYAPFLKDILDDGEEAGINWKKLNVGFVFSAEAFTEKFRDYVFKMTNPKNPLLSTLNHYGTVDLGTMAHETPESILIRRVLSQEKKLGYIFPESNRMATLAQYDPTLFYFEAEEHNLFCTAYSGLPLVRYDLKDYGGVFSRVDLHSKLNKNDIDIAELLKENKLSDKTWNLPYVYVYERNDFSVSYYAFLIYPETIKRTLQLDNFERILTGKFSMKVDYDINGRQRLFINIETKKGVDDNKKLEELIQKVIHERLLVESSEYRETSRMVGQDVIPIIKLWDYEDATYFRPGSKQRWVIK